MPSDLIYREDAKDYARHAIAKGLNVLEYLDEVPATIFRPVVLCKDCVHFQPFRPNINGFCKIDGMLWNDDSFCSNGKREES